APGLRRREFHRDLPGDRGHRLRCRTAPRRPSALTFQPYLHTQPRPVAAELEAPRVGVHPGRFKERTAQRDRTTPRPAPGAGHPGAAQSGAPAPGATARREALVARPLPVRVPPAVHPRLTGWATPVPPGGVAAGRNRTDCPEEADAFSACLCGCPDGP